MAITFKLRVDNPKIKDLRSFVRKTVTRDRTQYTDSQWDSETTFIDHQRDQLKNQFGWLWDMEDEALIRVNSVISRSRTTRSVSDLNGMHQLRSGM